MLSSEAEGSIVWQTAGHIIWQPCINISVKIYSSFYIHTYKVAVSTLSAWHWTCDSQVMGSCPAWAPLCSGLGQATYTYLPGAVMLFSWEGNRGPGGK